MFKPTPRVIEALRARVPAADLDAELARRRPDLTTLLLRVASADATPLGRELTAAVCRAASGRLGELHPGASIEVRVPPFAAVQIGFETGPRHTRGTPPNVVEVTPGTFIDLVVGRVAWEDADVRASGVHAHEVARVFPLA